MKNLSSCIFLLLTLSWVSCLSAQSLSAFLSGGDSLRQGERVQLTITASDLPVEMLTIPQLEGMVQVSGMHQQSSTTIRNGVRSQRATVSCTLEVVDTAFITVQPLLIEHEGEQFYTAPIKRPVRLTPGYRAPRGYAAPAPEAPAAPPIPPAHPKRKIHKL